MTRLRSTPPEPGFQPHVHVAEHIGELMERCECGATRLNDTWRIPDEARKWTEPPPIPENTQGSLSERNG